MTPKDLPVIFVDLPTGKNVADVKTRPKVLEKMTEEEIDREINKRLATTWKCLFDNYRQWQLIAKAFFFLHDVYDEELAHNLRIFD